MTEAFRSAFPFDVGFIMKKKLDFISGLPAIRTRIALQPRPMWN